MRWEKFGFGKYFKKNRTEPPKNQPNPEPNRKFGQLLQVQGICTKITLLGNIKL